MGKGIERFIEAGALGVIVGAVFSLAKTDRALTAGILFLVLSWLPILAVICVYLAYRAGILALVLLFAGSAAASGYAMNLLTLPSELQPYAWAYAMTTAFTAVPLAVISRWTIRSHLWKRAGAVGAATGLSIAALMMYVAWQHNPQGEFHDESAVHWLAWISIGAGWLVAVAPPVALVVGGLSAITRRLCLSPDKPMDPTGLSTPARTPASCAGGASPRRSADSGEST